MLESDLINEDTFDYLTIAKPRAGRFYMYMLPKIHQPDIYQDNLYDLTHESFRIQ